MPQWKWWSIKPMKFLKSSVFQFPINIICTFPNRLFQNYQSALTIWLDMHSSLVRVHKINYLSWKLYSFCLKHRCVYSSCSVFYCIYLHCCLYSGTAQEFWLITFHHRQNNFIATLTPFKYVKEFCVGGSKDKSVHYFP